MLLAPEDGAADYPDDLYAYLAEVETQHFWFSARARAVVSLLREILGNIKGRSVLDIGTGTGLVAAALESAGMVLTGLDMHLAGLRHARKRLRGLLVCTAAARLPFRAEFDVTTLCDVLEHVSDDRAILRETSRTLRKDGVVVITVPAGPHLWTVLDDLWGHKRRYTSATLRAVIEEAGLRPITLRHFNRFLYPLLMIDRLRLRKRSVSDRAERAHLIRQALRVPPWPVNVALSAVMAADVASARFGPPFGGSLIAAARRS